MLISEAQRTSSMRIPSRARNLAPAKISFLYPAPLHHLLHLHLPLFVPPFSVLASSNERKNGTSEEKNEKYAISSFVPSFVLANVSTLPLPTPSKSVLCSASVKKRREGKKKKSRGSNQRQAERQSRLRLGNDVGTGANFHESAFAQREMRARRRNGRGERGWWTEPASSGGERRMKGGRIGVGGNAGALALDYAFDRR